MRNFIALIGLSTALLVSSGVSAQEHYYHGRKADKKEWKMHKKESKIAKKMFNDKPAKAHRKKEKARKKAYKMEMKEYMGK